MINVNDLHIQQEILPLFGFTYNDFAKEALINLLQKPLASVEEISLRQKILKAFIANLKMIKDNPYSRIDLYEVHTFLGQYSEIDTSKSSFRWRLLTSKRARHQSRSRYIQVILLFYRLQADYFKKINISFFPESYRKELQSLDNFLSGFNPVYYNNLVQKQKFKISHIIRLANIISKKADKGEFKAFWERYFLFEAYLAISKGIARHQFSFPVFTETGLSFENLYHPLLKQAVKNSFASSNNVILLTGPNMSGKSTFLKAVGIAVYLGHVGLAVPASGAEMPFFDSISITINLNDDILNGYSHFMSEVMNLKKIVIEATDHKKCFAVFDELFRGTNMQDAVEISAATIKGLIQFKRSLFFISTHLHQLKEIDDIRLERLSTYCFNCELIEDIPVFSYHLKEGWSDLKLGRIIFEREGLNKLLEYHEKKQVDERESPDEDRPETDLL